MKGINFMAAIPFLGALFAMMNGFDAGVMFAAMPVR